MHPAGLFGWSMKNRSIREKERDVGLVCFLVTRYREGVWKPLTGVETMATQKVLVIDDELHIRMLYQEELEAAGYVVAVSDGSDEILQLLAKEHPDVIVLDIKLGPDLSGLDLLQEIRRDNQDIPVILCTAYDSFQQDFKSIAADFYVVKSVDSTDLLTKIALAMEKAKAGSKEVSPSELSDDDFSLHG